MNKAIIGIISITAIILAVFMYSSLREKSTTDSLATEAIKSRKVMAAKRVDFAKRRMELLKARENVEKIDTDFIKGDQKLVFEEFKDEEQLTDLQREILQELRTAFEADNKEEVFRIVQRMQAMAKSAAGGKGGSGDWASFFPASIRRMAVQALGWFGADSLPELAAFIADPDPVVADLALQQVESVLTDIELGDRELSPQIISLLSVIDNPMAVDSLMSSIPMRMRNSVGIETIIGIADTGTDVALEKLPETIRFFTGDSSIETVEAAQEWLASHPDSEFDDQMYGSIKAFFGNVDLVPVKVSDLPK